jgi:hypothetical protein
MKNIIPSIQTLLLTIPELKYVDEDWGQLDYYSPHFPVQWPCALIDIAAANFSNIGMDKMATPTHRQMATSSISLTIANLKLTNTSGKAPTVQKTQARSIWEIIDLVHAKIQGVNANATSGKLVRTALQRIKRDDGVQVYTVIYSLESHNV